VASPLTGWTAGQYVQTSVAGAPGRVTWSGTGWVGGVGAGLTVTTESVSAMTVEQAKQFVDEHPDQVREVFDAEQAGSARVTLLHWLQTLLDEEDAK
jgi:hypothetical protein